VALRECLKASPGRPVTILASPAGADPSPGDDGAGHPAKHPGVASRHASRDRLADPGLPVDPGTRQVVQQPPPGRPRDMAWLAVTGALGPAVPSPAAVTGLRPADIR
jgi:hypothetical protein